MNGTYDVYSKFDIEKHKETFKNYLEVCIDKDGVIHYAVPSHMKYMEDEFCKQYHMKHKELYNYVVQHDIMAWYFEFLLVSTKIVLVWDTKIKYDRLNLNQIISLKRLITAKLLHYSSSMNRKQSNECRFFKQQYKTILMNLRSRKEKVHD